MSRASRRRAVFAACLLALAGAACGAPAADVPARWTERFAREVDRRLEVPGEDQLRYTARLEQALAAAGLAPPPAQAFVMVDRSPQVQAAFVVLRTPEGGWSWVGAAPVSTGRPGAFEHFRTPLGVYAHTLDNPDFRAEGTYNENHIRGYGLRGMRVFDFGWALAERGWGDGGTSPMRLQMHATDPNVLEPRLGRAASKGCIRIPATLNVFLDRYGILDADYEQAAARGDPPWVLRRDRAPIAWPGRYLVIVDSQAQLRPPWSPLPGRSREPMPSAPAASVASDAMGMPVACATR